jgi:hypothetical protein
MFYPLAQNVFVGGWKPASPLVSKAPAPSVAAPRPSFITPASDAAFKIDNFDWDEFGEMLENAEIESLEDFDDRGDITQELQLYSKGPLPDIKEFIEEFNRSNAIEENYPEFYRDVEEKVKQAGKGNFWEHEESTQPMGYHGRFRSIYVLVDLNDIYLEEISDLKQFDDGRIYMGLLVGAPSQSKGWQSDYLA